MTAFLSFLRNLIFYPAPVERVIRDARVPRDAKPVRPVDPLADYLEVSRADIRAYLNRTPPLRPVPAKRKPRKVVYTGYRPSRFSVN